MQKVWITSLWLEGYLNKAGILQNDCPKIICIQYKGRLKKSVMFCNNAQVIFGSLKGYFSIKTLQVSLNVSSTHKIQRNKYFLRYVDGKWSYKLCFCFMKKGIQYKFMKLSMSILRVSIYTEQNIFSCKYPYFS